MRASTEGAYLRDVGKRLRALTPKQREAVLDDVRAHFADAADAGRTPEQAAESLGGSAQFTERVRAELGHEPDRTDRISRILLWLATGVAVFTAMFLTFLLPMDGGYEFDELGYESDALGFEIVLLHLIPALIVVLPILLPARVRRITITAAAIVLTVASFATFEGVHFVAFYLPTAMLTWAALLTPIISRNGRPAAGWRIAGGVLTALPGIFLLSRLLIGGFGTDSWGVLGITVSFALALLIAVGKTWAGVALAVGGVALLIMSPLGLWIPVLVFWWVGGLFLTVGASHALAHAPLRKPAQK